MTAGRHRRSFSPRPRGRAFLLASLAWAALRAGKPALAGGRLARPLGIGDGDWDSPLHLFFIVPSASLLSSPKMLNPMLLIVSSYYWRVYLFLCSLTCGINSFVRRGEVGEEAEVAEYNGTTWLGPRGGAWRCATGAAGGRRRRRVERGRRSGARRLVARAQELGRERASPRRPSSRVMHIGRWRTTEWAKPSAQDRVDKTDGEDCGQNSNDYKVSFVKVKRFLWLPLKQGLRVDFM